ncbi:hypothetical protein RDWZM_008307, partial [Blomia tropicalis]
IETPKKKKKRVTNKNVILAGLSHIVPSGRARFVSRISLDNSICHWQCLAIINAPYSENDDDDDDEYGDNNMASCFRVG